MTVVPAMLLVCAVPTHSRNRAYSALLGSFLTGQEIRPSASRVRPSLDSSQLKVASAMRSVETGAIPGSRPAMMEIELISMDAVLTVKLNLDLLAKGALQPDLTPVEIY